MHNTAVDVVANGKTVHPKTFGGLDETVRSNFCGLDTTKLGPFLDPPKEITDLLGATIGIGWGISPVDQFSEYNEACAELSTMFDSNEDFVVVSISGELGSGLDTGLVTGESAKKLMCDREDKKKRLDTSVYKTQFIDKSSNGCVNEEVGNQIICLYPCFIFTSLLCFVFFDHLTLILLPTISRP